MAVSPLCRDLRVPLIWPATVPASDRGATNHPDAIAPAVFDRRPEVLVK